MNLTVKGHEYYTRIGGGRKHIGQNLVCLPMELNLHMKVKKLRLT
jgi:hypothetical protein